MSTISILYNDVSAASDAAFKAMNEMGDYSDSITVRAINKLRSITDDASGYLAEATACAKAKQSELSAKRDALAAFTTDLDSFLKTAQDADKAVKNNIEALAEPYTQGNSFVEWVGSAVYNFFCIDAPNWISEHIPFGDVIINTISSSANTIEHWYENIRDAFTYGVGEYGWLKYVGNIVSSAADFILAGIMVAGTIAAAVYFSPVLIGIACIAGGAYLLYKFFNMAATTKSNEEALKAYKNGNTGLAHYYSGADDVVDYVEKHDFGDSGKNLTLEIAAKTYDIIGKTSKEVLNVVAIATTVDALGATYEPQVTKNSIKRVRNGYDWSLSNVNKNVERKFYEALSKAGFKIGGGGEFSLKALIFGETTYDFTQKTKLVVSLIDKGIENLSSNPTTAVGKFEDTLNTYKDDPTIKNATKVWAELVSLPSGIFKGLGDLTDLFFPGKDFVEDINELIFYND